jgi:MraZ protein
MERKTLGRSFRGESVHKVDSKGRVSIPASFRRTLEEGDPDFASSNIAQVVINYGVRANECLEGYSISGMEEIDANIRKVAAFSDERESLEFMFNTQSVYVQLDDTGRIVLSAKLRELFGLGDEVVFAGMNNRFQIWEPKAFEARRQAMGAQVASREGRAAVLAQLGKVSQG